MASTHSFSNLFMYLQDKRPSCITLMGSNALAWLQLGPSKCDDVLAGWSTSVCMPSSYRLTGGTGYVTRLQQQHPLLFRTSRVWIASYGFCCCIPCLVCRDFVGCDVYSALHRCLVKGGGDINSGASKVTVVVRLVQELDAWQQDTSKFHVSCAFWNLCKQKFVSKE